MLETTWHTPTGWLTVQDMLVMGPPRRQTAPERLPPPPGDASAQGTLLRIATCFDGEVEVDVNCLPLFDYGRTPGTWSYAGEGYDSASCRRTEGLDLRSTEQLALGIVGARAYGRTTLTRASRRSSRSRGATTAPATLDEASAQLGRPSTTGASG